MACSDHDYEYLRGVVKAQSANLIDPSRNALFDTRLTPMARLAGVTKLEELGRHPEDGPEAATASCCGGGDDD